MASAGDVRDILDLGRRAPGPKLKQKKKAADARPRTTGLNRELQGLMGDSVPPVHLQEAPKYKSKPQLLQARNFKPRHWGQREFTHGARTDGLVFRHWKRAIPGVSLPIATTPNETEPDTADVGGEVKAPDIGTEYKYEDEFPSEKWNVMAQTPSYNEEQYAQHLKADDWTKEETDYLMNLCREYDLRWVLIADRYDRNDIPASTENPTAVSDPDAMAVDNPEPDSKPHYSDRSMESLKSRYYTVAAKMFELQMPPSNMTQEEFSLLERMKNFDAKTETTRKALVEKLFERSKEEAEEEKLLLEELHRIVRNEEEFLKMRKELYDRLDPAPSKRSNGEEQSTAMYQTSSGLSILLQTLLAKEKRFKRPMGLTNGPDGAHTGSAASAEDRRHEKARHSAQYNRRDTLDSHAEDRPQKKGSQSQRSVRTLTEEEEQKYGVSRPPERLTGGVSFRHDKISKITTGKSQVQTQKLQAALAELQIPARLVMPTDKVCKEFEKLVAQIQILLDIRKAAEKVGTEVKVLDDMRRQRLEIESGVEAPASADKMDVDHVDTSEVKSSPTALADNSKRDVNGDDDEGEEDEDDTMQQDDHEQEQDDEDRDSGDEHDSDAEVGDAAEEEEEEEAEVANEDDNEQDSGADEDEDEEVEAEEDEEEELQVDDSFAERENVANESEDEDEDEEDAEAEVNEDDEAEAEDGDDDEDNEDNEEQADGPDSEEEEGEEEAEAADGGPAAESASEAEAEESEAASELSSRPPSSESAQRSLHKRSASVISDASKTGSNRSVVSRKRRR